MNKIYIYEKKEYKKYWVVLFLLICSLFMLFYFNNEDDNLQESVTTKESVRFKKESNKQFNIGKSFDWNSYKKANEANELSKESKIRSQLLNDANILKRDFGFKCEKIISCVTIGKDIIIEKFFAEKNVHISILEYKTNAIANEMLLQYFMCARKEFKENNNCENYVNNFIIFVNENKNKINEINKNSEEFNTPEFIANINDMEISSIMNYCFKFNLSIVSIYHTIESVIKLDTEMNKITNDEQKNEIEVLNKLKDKIIDSQEYAESVNESKNLDESVKSIRMHMIHQ